jgi:hypothetical protein
MCFYPSPRATPSSNRTPPPRDPAKAFFHEINFHLPWASRGAQSGDQDDPKCPKGAKNDAKSSLSGAKSVTFRCEIGESGSFLKHQQGLCFHHIMKVRGSPLLLGNSPQERTAHRERSSSYFWFHFWCPSGTQGRPREHKNAQKEIQSIPGDT